MQGNAGNFLQQSVELRSEKLLAATNDSKLRIIHTDISGKAIWVAFLWALKKCGGGKNHPSLNGKEKEVEKKYYKNSHANYIIGKI